MCRVLDTPCTTKPSEANRKKQHSLRIIATLRSGGDMRLQTKETPPPILGEAFRNYRLLPKLGYHALYLQDTTLRGVPTLQAKTTSVMRQRQLTNYYGNTFAQPHISPGSSAGSASGTGDPRASDTINDDPIIKCSPDVILS